MLIKKNFLKKKSDNISSLSTLHDSLVSRVGLKAEDYLQILHHPFLPIHFIKLKMVLKTAIRAEHRPSTESDSKIVSEKS